MSERSTTLSPVDASAREQALSLEQSFICVAPAGSGKTELLTQRLLVLLAHAKQPEEILAITFTRKAAAEMRHRVIGALQKAEGPEPELAHAKHTWQLARAALKADQAHGWQLSKNPERLQIKTFDGLCASLVKALPLQAAMGAGLTLATHPAEYYQQAAESLLLELESDSAISDALAILLGHLDNRMTVVRDLFIALLHSRAVWLPALMSGVDMREVLEQCLAQVVSDHLTRVCDAFTEGAAERVLAMADFAARHLPAESNSIIRACLGLRELPAPSEQALPQWQALAEFLLTKNGGFRKRFTKNEGIPPKVDDLSAAELKALKSQLTALIEDLESNELLGELLVDIRSLPYTRYPENQWQLLQALVSVLPRLVAHLQVCFAAACEMDFTEMSLRADQALGEVDAPTDLALRLDHRIAHILVDEFQDTSSQQMQLIEKLTAGWQAGDGRTLFCVGDAMQSIYAFRSANVGLFLRCLGHEAPGYIGDIPLKALRLSTNFRSSQTVVDWVNNTFSTAFSAAVDLNLGAVPYNRADAFNGAEGNDGVQVRAFSGEQALASEAAFVGDQIAALIARDPECTVAILGRGRRQLARILPALAARDIRYRAVDLDPLASLSAVQDARALTEALLDPANTIAWLAVLRAPWCGLTLSDLLALRALPGLCVLEQLQRIHTPEAQSTLSADGIARLLRVQTALAAAVNEQGRKALADRVQGVWAALGGAAVTTLYERNNLTRFWEALADFDEADLLSNPQQLEHIMANLYALPDPDASSQVQVMTMHKSKGLEFDAVFLVGLADASGKPDAPLLRWHEQVFERANIHAQSEWLISPVGEQGKDKDPLYQWLGLQEKKRERLEACRLLYVACTRAKRQLYLSACLKPDDKSPLQVAAPSANSLLATIWRQVSDTLQVRSSGDERSPRDEPSARAIKRLGTTWQAPAIAMLDNLADSHFDSDSDRAAPKSADSQQDWLANTHPNETAEGLLLHELLELWLPAKLHGRAVPEQWHDYYPLWRQRLTALGHSGGLQKPVAIDAQLGLFDALPTEDNEPCERIGSMLCSALNETSPLMQALAKARAVHTEYSLTQVTEAGIEQLRVDAWWRDEQGKVWLLDYKSATPQGSEAQAAFERRQIARFRGRLQGYAQALAAHLDEQVTPVLYLVSTQSWLVVGA